MKPRPLLVLMATMTVAAASGTFIENKYKKLEPGGNFTGTIRAELKTRSKQECSVSCSKDGGCFAYQYKVGQEMCGLLGNEDKSIFISSTRVLVYQKDGVAVTVTYDAWATPGYTGPDPIEYWSLNNLDGITLMIGTGQGNYDPLVTGKVGNALSFNHTQSQWAYLGIHTDACITRADNCTNGGAISLWVRVKHIDDGSRGIITTYRGNSPSTGTAIYTSSGKITCEVDVNNGYYLAGASHSGNWTHVVCSYLGSDVGEGATIYLDGVLKGMDSTVSGNSFPEGDGKVVLGRWSTDGDGDYASVDVDEVLFFNQFLTDDQISQLANV